MQARWPWITCLAPLILSSVSSVATAAVTDPTFTETALVSSPELAGATGLAWAPDGSNRLFVTRKDGVILVIKNGVLLPTPFATVTPVYQASECGLIGIALDPNFLVNQHLYVFATVSVGEQQIIRYTATGDIGTAKATVVAGLPTVGANHDGGAIGFGADGKIYWGIGDLGNGTGVLADLTSLAAKIGRANLDGTAVTDNPFADAAGPNADHIWARGFRNPFTLTFQPATGLLWVQDVGASYEQIFIVRQGDHAGWTQYENNQPAGFITPVIKYRTNSIDTLTIAAAAAGASRSAGTVTFTTTEAHNFRLGEKITVSGVADASFNGSHFVAAVPGPTSFRVPQAGPDGQSGGGTAQTQAIGGCVTGGAFYDSTGLPAAYRGNFFFGDCNTGRIERATIDAGTNTVTSVDHWAEGVATAVDIALGPDGALYYVGYGSQAVFRASPQTTIAGLVVSPTNLWMAEGQPAVVMVRLAVNPNQDVMVSAAAAGTDADIGVLSGAMLTFTSANWSTPQPVTVRAGHDLDSTDDLGMVTLIATGLPAETVTVHARDENRVALRVSAATLVLDEENTASFTVALSEEPSLDVAVSVIRVSGDDDITVSSGSALIFTRASWSTPQTVTVAAAADPDSADDSASLVVVALGLPEQTVTVSAQDNDPDPPDAGPDAATLAPDAGAPAPDATAAPDTTAAPDAAAAPDVAAAPDAAAAAPDAAAGGQADGRDGSAARADAARIPVRTGGSGCSCHTGSAPGPNPTPGPLVLLMLLALIFRKTR